MCRILFLILIVTSSVAFAQTEENTGLRETPKAIKFDEFEKATNGFVKWRMDAFFVELSNNPAAQGYIINYGTNKEVAKREKQVRNSIAFRRYHTLRITFVRGENQEVIKTELWLVPPGTEAPTPVSQDKKD